MADQALRGATLGRSVEGDALLRIDVGRLVSTRMLLQASSGAGKSWAIRRVLEQTHGAVQHLVLDPEGEFATLRERFDYVLARAGGEGDCPADPRSASLLARKLLELGVSAILDIYELKAHERVQFVRRFVEALVAAPKALWHPCLVVIDEAHQYCPQTGEAESAGAVKDLMTLGRKRQFAGILATQRISKLHKDAAAEAGNKLIGRTGLDLDMKRASDELGLSGRDRQLELRTLANGEFFAFGPALSDQVVRVQVGDVLTTHLSGTARAAAAPPPAPQKVRAVLAKLADLPAEAEQEARTMEDLRARLAAAEREVAKLRAGVPAIDPAVVGKAHDDGYAEAIGEVREQIIGYRNTAHDELGVIKDFAGGVIAGFERLYNQLANYSDALAAKAPAPEWTRNAVVQQALQDLRTQQRPEARAPVATPPRNPEPGDLRPYEEDIVKTLVSRHPVKLTPAQLGTLSGKSRGSSTWNTAMAKLRREGWIVTENGNVLPTDKAVRSYAGQVDPPATRDEALRMWKARLSDYQAAILQAVYDARSHGATPEQISDFTSFSRGSSTWNTALALLRKNKLITPARSGRIYPGEALDV